MSPRRRRVLARVAVVALAATVCACGSDEKPAVVTVTKTVTATQSATTPSTGPVLPAVSATPEFGGLLAGFLDKGVVGMDDWLPTTAEPCLAIGVYGAELQEGAVDLERISKAGAGCGDGASTLYRIRDRAVIGTFSACWECGAEQQGAQSDYLAALAAYAGRPAVLFDVGPGGHLLPEH